MKRAVLALALVLLAGCSAPEEQPPAPPAPTSSVPEEPTAVPLPASAPDTITLPPGFSPEGIAVSPVDNTAYLGDRETGAIIRVDLATGSTTPLVPASGTPAQGMKLDARGRLYVAGADSGHARIFDTRSGKQLADFSLVARPTEDNNLINDGVLTSDAWWLTDSRNAVLYRIALPADGSVPTQLDVSTVKLTGDFAVSAGINANGIAADGSSLYIVQSNTGKLFRVSASDGRATQVQLGTVSLDDGDGLLLDGTTLYVAQNDPNTLTVLRLDPSGVRGSLVTRIKDPRFDKPTTIGAVGSRLYLPNARFDLDPTPTTRYTLVSVPRPG